MQYDLKLIKKYYGENTAHLCRRLFPTLLEKDGVLIELIESKFAHSKFLYDDIIYEELEDDFQSFIYSLTTEPVEPLETEKSVQELLEEAGYNFYECKTEDDVQKFKKFYEPGEELCTFDGGRLKICHVFFAVKKDLDHIKRDNFPVPRRQDEYGTSVISIQFTRGEYNTLSIKNRYNHTVRNPDATFRNNLENIVPGLTRAFEKQYGFQINQNIGDFKIENYVIASDGKFYSYDYESDNIYYGPNNIIIDGFKVQQEFLDKSRYIVIGVLILDLKEKKLYWYNPKAIDLESLPEYIGNIETIVLTNLENGNKKVLIRNDKEEETNLILSPKNRIIGFINNYIKEIKDRRFLWMSLYIKYFEARGLEKIGDAFLNGGMDVVQFIAPNLREVGNGFLAYNEDLEVLDCQNLEKVGYNFLKNHSKYKIDNFDKRVTTKSKAKYIKASVRNKIYQLGYHFKSYFYQN